MRAIFHTVPGYRAASSHRKRVFLRGVDELIPVADAVVVKRRLRAHFQARLQIHLVVEGLPAAFHLIRFMGLSTRGTSLARLQRIPVVLDGSALTRRNT
jgi:hypothetical protein